MRIVMLYHSIVSDWNHGNAHFLRGVTAELQARGHDVTVFEPRDPWSRVNLLREHGGSAIDAFHETFPDLAPRGYDEDFPELESVLDEADLVLVHEWNDPELVARVGEHHAMAGNYSLLFHDTHHRSITKPAEMARYDLKHYDGVLAFGDVIREIYERRAWAANAWTWHEAADTRVFRPVESAEKEGDLVWIGNWGDGERTRELHEFLLDPVKDLGLDATVHGVRYPPKAKKALAAAGIRYADWLPNHRVPEAFARHRVTVHVPRRPYVYALPGVPTIRPFEALACGIPLVTAPWNDSENLFTPGRDFLVAGNGDEMRAHLRAILEDEDLAQRLAEHGLRTIREKHTCAHRVDELMDVHRGIQGGASFAPRRHASPAPARGDDGLRIAFIGSSLVSALWNGAATYYRGLIRALAERGHRVTFYEPDARDRQKHRDMDDPDWCKVVVWEPTEAGARHMLKQAAGADVVVKASGVGVLDEFLEENVLDLQSPTTSVVYWDVDAPATLDRVRENPDDPFRALIPRYDLVCTYGGGPPVVDAYEGFGARKCVPVYNAHDPLTHHPAPPDERFESDLAFLGNRLPDREERVEEFFLKAAERLPDKRFLLGGSGWGDKPMPDNVEFLGHVGTADHNAFNCTPRAVLNISRASMARYGYSPATRVFEAAAAGACLITDAWEGIDHFLEPGEEILVAEDGDEVAAILQSLTEEDARHMGLKARARVLREHTYADRAAQVERLLLGLKANGASADEQKVVVA